MAVCDILETAPLSLRSPAAALPLCRQARAEARGKVGVSVGAAWGGDQRMGRWDQDPAQPTLRGCPADYRLRACAPLASPGQGGTWRSWRPEGGSRGPALHADAHAHTVR